MKRLALLPILSLLLLVGCSSGPQSQGVGDLSTPEGAISEYLRSQADGDIPAFCRVLTKNTQIYLILSLGSSETDCQLALEESGQAALKVMGATADYLRLQEIKRTGPNRAVVYFDGPDGEVTRDLVRKNGLWKVEIIPSG